MRLFLFFFLLSLFSCQAGSLKVHRGLANQGYYYVIGEQAFRSDRSFINRHLSQDIPMLFDFFGEERTEIMRIIPYRIVLQAKPDNEVYEGQAMLSSGTRNGRLDTYYANVRALALSQYQGHGQTLTGDPHDEHFFRKLMVHEYTTVVADVLMRNKKSGWRYFNAPRWFIEGFVEYFAFNFSGEVNLERFKKLKKVTQLNQALLENPYVFGPRFIEYLIERFGKESLISFVLSEKKTFQDAFKEVYQMSHHSLIRTYKSSMKII